MKPADTTIKAWANLMRAQQLVLSSIEGDLKRAELPPLAWYDVLLELDRSGDAGLRPFELERAMLLAQYNLSRLIDRIERAGYVERRACEEDGRGQRIAITPEGKAIRRKMWPVYAQAIEGALGRRLTCGQIESLAEILSILVKSHRIIEK